jgi:hypothetical protein
MDNTQLLAAVEEDTSQPRMAEPLGRALVMESDDDI